VNGRPVGCMDMEHAGMCKVYILLRNKTPNYLITVKPVFSSTCCHPFMHNRPIIPLEPFIEGLMEICVKEFEKLTLKKGGDAKLMPPCIFLFPDEIQVGEEP